jgi:hypothetical protein
MHCVYIVKGGMKFAHDKTRLVLSSGIGISTDCDYALFETNSICGPSATRRRGVGITAREFDA